MSEFAFVVTTEEGDTVEYRTRGASLTATEAVERCRGKYPNGTIERTVQGDFSDVDYDFMTHRDSPTESESTGDATSPERSSLSPSDMTVSELEDALETHDWSDNMLESLMQAEENAQDRTTAKDAIESELEQ